MNTFNLKKTQLLDNNGQAHEILIQSLSSYCGATKAPGSLHKWTDSTELNKVCRVPLYLLKWGQLTPFFLKKNID